MNILIIDDERHFDAVKLTEFLHIEHDFSFVRWPHQIDTLHYEPANVVLYARTLDEAQNAMMFHEWDVVFLDHDLGDYHDVSLLTNMLEENAHKGVLLNVSKFVIHSMNPLGRMKMYDSLHKFYNVEFARVEDLV